MLPHMNTLAGSGAILYRKYIWESGCPTLGMHITLQCMFGPTKNITHPTDTDMCICTNLNRLSGGRADTALCICNKLNMSYREG